LNFVNFVLRGVAAKDRQLLRVYGCPAAVRVSSPGGGL
jgi:hypothetical protein